MSSPFIPRPRLTIRLGVTGTRSVAESVDAHEAAAHEAEVREKVGEVIATIAATMQRLATVPEIAEVYDLTQSPLIRMVSPLAKGADRLVAEVALAHHAELEVITPFPVDAYEKDSPDIVEEFRTLRDSAGGRVFELDGERHDEIDAMDKDDPARRVPQDERNRAYEAVGHMVVRNADLVIALWDRRPAEGRGGTGDIVRYAAAFGPPVVRISPDGAGEPEWIFDLADLHGATPWTSPRAPEPIGATIDRYLTATLTPPTPPTETKGFVERWLCCSRSAEDPLKAFLAEMPRRRRFWWRLYDAVIRIFAGRPDSRGDSGPTAVPPQAPVWCHWQAIRSPADDLAVVFSERYRTAAVLAYLSAAVALMAAGFGLFHHHVAATATEFAGLLVIFVLYCANLRMRWHKRFVSYRLLAELARNQQALALVGSSLPIDATNRATGEVSDDDAEQETWVGWYFQAMMRGSPLPTGSVAQALPEIIGVIRTSLLDDQRRYHERNHARCETAAENMELVSGILFFLTIAVVIIELLMVCHEFEEKVSHLLAFLHLSGHIGGFLGFVTISAASCSAALFGILSFSELKVHAEQSARMAGIMAAASRRLEAAADALVRRGTTGRPMGSLHSQELAIELRRVTTEMLGDITGWSRLSRVKSLGL